MSLLAPDVDLSSLPRQDVGPDLAFALSLVTSLATLVAIGYRRVDKINRYYPIVVARGKNP